MAAPRRTRQDHPQDMSQCKQVGFIHIILSRRSQCRFQLCLQRRRDMTVFITTPQRSCGKVTFSVVCVCVCRSVHRGPMWSLLTHDTLDLTIQGPYWPCPSTPPKPNMGPQCTATLPGPQTLDLTVHGPRAWTKPTCWWHLVTNTGDCQHFAGGGGRSLQMNDSPQVLISDGYCSAYGWQAGGTHPTEMLSCFRVVFVFKRMGGGGREGVRVLEYLFHGGVCIHRGDGVVTHPTGRQVSYFFLLLGFVLLFDENSYFFNLSYNLTHWYNWNTLFFQGGVCVREASVGHDRGHHADVPDTARPSDAPRGRHHRQQGPQRLGYPFYIFNCTHYSFT